MFDEDKSERKSKSQVKREMQELRDLGKKIVDHPNVKFDSLPMSEDLQEAILQARKLKREALKRQIQHIGALLREEDADVIRLALDGISHPTLEQNQAFQEVEKWRDSLISGDDALLAQFIDTFPGADRQHVRQLIKNAKKEGEKKKPPKSSKALFRYITALTRSE